jgi:diacylglycerol kinase (ATP)
MSSSPFKGGRGLARVMAALRHSLAGFRFAWIHESAFRQELAIGLVLAFLAPLVARGPLELIVLIGSVLLVLLVELLNSAIEAVCDAVSLERHPLLGRSKDLGSAAVLASLLILGLCWGVILLDRLRVGLELASL